MSKKFKLHIVIFSFVFTVISILIIIFSTNYYCKNKALKTMNTELIYLKNQCISFEQAEDDELVKSLISVADSTKFARGYLNANLNYLTDDLITNYLIEHRLSEIAITENGVINYSKFIDEIDSEILDKIIFDYSNNLNSENKLYTKRIYKNDYFYDYALISRFDGKGVIICYVRQNYLNTISSTISLSNLLSGFSNVDDAKIIITNQGNTIATNIIDNYNSYLKSFESFNSYDKNYVVKINGKKHFAIKSRCKSYSICVFYPERIIYKTRNISILYTIIILMGIYILEYVICIINGNLKKKELEKLTMSYNEQIKKSAIEAINANNAKDDFLKRMSHDLRTPITGIKGLLEIGDYYSDNIEKQNECRNKIKAALNYLIDLTNNILDITKYEAKILKLQIDKFNLDNLLLEVSTIAQIKCNAKALDFKEAKLDIKHKKLIGCSIFLKRILINLIDNAIKYNKPNGYIKLACKEIRSIDNNATYEFIVEDSGIGMSDDFKKIMYDEYTQEANNSGEYMGVGLGLAIVKSYVDKMNGTIEVESKKDFGTKFKINLFFEIDDTIDEKETIDFDLTNKKILVVDDNELNLEIIEFMLSTLNCKILKASSANEAINIYKASNENEIDLILMDILMPKIDGVTATKTIRSIDRNDAKKIKIIAMSANTFDDDISDALKSGMNDYISKPIDRDNLIKIIKKNLN